MAYIGRQLARGTNRLFDDISSSFNGSTTVFNLTIASVATATATPFQLFVSLGGVMQKPSTDFTTAGNQITFTTAPAAGLSCWIMMQGDTIDQAAISDASVTPSKISNSGDFAFPADIRLKDGDGSHYVGFQSATTVSNSLVWTLPATDGSANQYLKTNGSGVLSWGSDSTSDPSKMPLAGGAFTGDVTLNAQKDLRFADSDSSNWVAFQAPATISSNVTWTLPAADGSANQLLTTNGSGVLSWSTAAGGLSSDAQQNTVGGTNAGDSFTGTDAEKNTLIGYDAGTALTSGDNNVCIGNEAGKTITNNSGHTFIGGNAGKLVSGGGSNIAIGIDSMSGSAVTGYNNIAMGTETLNALTSSQNNICIGYRAGYTQTAGGTNIFMGRTAGHNIVLGSSNIAIGADAMYAASSCNAANNIAIGNSALRQVQSNASWNFAFGHNVLYNITTGINNTGAGYAAGYDATTVNNCLFLGNDAGRSDSPSGAITTSGDGTVCLGNNSINNLYCADTSISSSDSRDKTDVTNFTHGLDWVKKLNPITYRWDRRTWYKEYNEDGSLKTAGTPDGSKKRARQHIGFLAQDVLAIEQADGYASKKDDMLVINLNEDDSAYGLKYERLVPVLVNAIKELSTEVTTLKTKVATLESA